MTPSWFTLRPAIVAFPTGVEMMPVFVLVPAPAATWPTHTSSPRRLASPLACAAIAI